MPDSDTTFGDEAHQMEAPIYQVDTPSSMPTLWFSADEYELAFETATGTSISDAEEHEEESNITVLDFDGSVEVPVAHV